MSYRRHTTQENRHEAGLDALREVVARLARQTGQRESIERILDVLAQQLGIQRGSVMLSSASGEELVAGAAEPPGDGNGHNGNGAAEAFSLVRVPIVAEHEVIGTLTADLPSQDPPLLEQDRKVLEVAAGLIAMDVIYRRTARRDCEVLEHENQRLLGTLREQYRPEGIVGNSRAMREVCTRIRQLAGSDIPLLVRGEPGTGKELVAKVVHTGSSRCGGPLVRVSCTGLSEGMLDCELFGQEKGPHAGAPPRRNGRVEEAEGGTLFLDEVGDFSPALQVKLLRLIQDREFERVGGGVARKANVRIIAATAQDLESAVRLGRFRQDLYYRLGVFPIVLPPLRERRDDVLLLANTFVEKYRGLLGKTVRRISTPAIDMLLAYHWPGNVRELENCIEHAILTSTDDVIHGHNLPPTLQSPDGSEKTARRTLKEQIHVLERDAIVDALKRAGGSISLASRELGITGRMVRYKIKQLEIDYRGLFKGRSAERGASKT